LFFLYSATLIFVPLLRLSADREIHFFIGIKRVQNNYGFVKISDFPDAGDEGWDASPIIGGH
jgi:hypothetical protein